MKNILLTLALLLASVISANAQKLYTFKQFGNKYVVSIMNHNDVVTAVTKFCEDQNIQAGSVIGIGAVNSATLRFFNPATKQYVDKTFDGQMEITNLTGNVSTMDDKTYLHLHITLGRSDYSAIAGHLLSATLNGAGEVVIEKFDGVVDRYHDAAIGLNMYKFED